MESAYEPEENDFLKIRLLIQENRNIYDSYYKPLRNKIFAHSDAKRRLKTDELWQATKYANIEDVLSFLENLRICLNETFLNGRKPELRTEKFDEEYFARDIRSLLDRVKHA